MKAIFFLKALRKKHYFYYEIWLDVLIKMEDKPIQIINFTPPIGHAKKTYLNGIEYGISIFDDFALGYKLQRVYNGISLIRDNVPRETQDDFKELKLDLDVEIIDPEAEIKKQVEEIILFLNEATDKGFRPSTKSYIALIKAKLKENYTVADFKHVITTKANNWKGKPAEIHLRPETLFGDRFDSYLNESPQQNKQQQAYETVVAATELGWKNSNRASQ